MYRNLFNVWLYGLPIAAAAVVPLEERAPVNPRLFPYLIVPLDAKNPSKSYGTQNTGILQYNNYGTRWDTLVAFHVPPWWANTCSLDFLLPTTNPSYSTWANKPGPATEIHGGNPGYDPSWIWKYQDKGARAGPFTVKVYRLYSGDVQISQATYANAVGIWGSQQSKKFDPPGTLKLHLDGTRTGTWTLNPCSGGDWYFQLTADTTSPYYFWWYELNWRPNDKTGAGDTGPVLQWRS